MWRKMGYSSAIPLAPRMSRAMRAHSSAIQTLLRFADLADHPDQLLLHELVRGDGLIVELLAELRVLQRAVVAGHRRSNCAPRDAVTRLVQAAQGRLQPARLRQQVLRRNANILQGKTRCH